MITIPTQFGQIFQVFPGAARGVGGNLGILETLSKYFRPSTVGGINLNWILGRPSAAPFPLPKISTGTKILGTTAGVGLIAVSLPLGQEGQTGIETIATTTQQVTEFFSKNPLILLAVVGLGIVLVIKK